MAAKGLSNCLPSFPIMNEPMKQPLFSFEVLHHASQPGLAVVSP